MGKMIDLTNQVFGKLTVQSCAGKIDGRRYYWNCLCDCGKEIVIEGSRLRSGNTKSCGCGKYDGLKKYNLNQSSQNKIQPGTRFGKLTVIKDIGYRKQVEGHSRLWYLCKCDCGNEKEVMGNCLKQNQISSCGKCQINSLGEYQIQQILDNFNINYLHDTIFPDLVKQTNRKLRFDFIIYDEDFLKPIRFIEFDGRQHLHGPDNEYWSHGDTIEIIKERDNIKNNFCLNNGYPLIRIPYFKLNNISLEDIMGDKYLVKGDGYRD